MNDRCRAGVLDLIVARVPVHTARASGTAAPNAAILGVGSATSAAVLPPHWTVEQSDWNKAEKEKSVREWHYFNVKQTTQYVSHISHTRAPRTETHDMNGPHHTDPPRCRCGTCFFSSRWSWLRIPPSGQNRRTGKRRTTSMSTTCDMAYELMLCTLTCKAVTACVKLSGCENQPRTLMETQKYIMRRWQFIDFC